MNSAATLEKQPEHFTKNSHGALQKPAAALYKNSRGALQEQQRRFTRTAAALYKNSSGAEIKRRRATGLRRQSIRHAIDAGVLDQTNPFKTVGLTLWVATAILNAFTLFGALP